MFTYPVHNPLSRQFITRLPLSSVTFNDPLNTPGTLSGQLQLGSHISRDVVDAATQETQAIYAQDQDTGDLVWGGLITGRDWDPVNAILTITAQQASWYYTRAIAYGGLPQGQVHTWTDIDQFRIVQDIISNNRANNGALQVQLPGSVTSGVTRRLTIDPSGGQTVADAINTLAVLDQGFDWKILPRVATDGLPEFYLAMYSPRYDDVPRYLLSATLDGGTIASYGTVSADYSNIATSVQVLGLGAAPYQMHGDAADPNIGFHADGSPGKLLLTRTDTYGSIADQATLTSYAQQILAAASETTATLPVTINTGGTGDLNWRDIVTGSRQRLRIKDQLLDWDLPAVRIIDRAYTDATRTEPATIALTLDLADYEVPVEDTTGQGG